MTVTFRVRTVAGDEIGPVDAASLRNMAAAGILTPSCSVSRVGSSDRWVQAASIKGLRFPPPPYEELELAAPATPVAHPVVQRSTATARPGGSYEYSVVPFSAIVGPDESQVDVAKLIEKIIVKKSSQGWEYVGLHQISATKAGCAGCFGFGKKHAQTLRTEFLVFRR
jgi:hypothetical protein